eukprot:GILI01030359.1.p1 GENE.GILI01030359.1~~GILI01030359.1.p1  ORF type:complete len:130 (-),score=19.44 GILI01030359.1:89-478(-)
MASSNSYVVDSRMEDVDRASNMIPFNLAAGKRLLNAPLHNTVPVAAFDRKEVAELQSDLGDYVTSLDTRLRGLFAHNNEALAKRVKETEHMPTLLSYFQLQQRMLTLTNDLTTKREKEMLTQLASLIEN